MKTNLTTRYKLTGLSLAGLVFVLIVGAIAYRTDVNLGATIDDMSLNGEALKNGFASDMMHDAMRADVLAALLAGSKNSKDDGSRQALTRHAVVLRESVGKLDALPLNGDIRNALATVRPAMDVYLKSAESMVNLALTDPPAATAALPAFMITFADLEKKLETLSEFIAAQSKAAGADGKEHAKSAQRMMIIATLLAAGTLLAVGMLTSRGITRQLGGEPAYATEVANRVAAGDLSVEVRVEGDDSSLLAAMRHMQRSLAHIVSGVRSGAEAICPVPTPTCRSGPSSRPVRSRRPPRRWKN